MFARKIEEVARSPHRDVVPKQLRGFLRGFSTYKEYEAAFTANRTDITRRFEARPRFLPEIAHPNGYTAFVRP